MDTICICEQICIYANFAHLCKKKYFLLYIHMALWKQEYFCQKLEIAV